MQARIEFDEYSVECNFMYPFYEQPISVPGPMGTLIWQKQPCNAKLVLPLIIQLPSEFVIKSEAKIYRSALHCQRGSDAFCVVSEI
jgi:hypothetical protein